MKKAISATAQKLNVSLALTGGLRGDINKTFENMKYLIIAFFIILMACSNSQKSNELFQSNNAYNYCVNVNNEGDSINSNVVSSDNDSILVQLGEGFNQDTLKLVTNVEKFKEMILNENQILGYSGFMKLSPETKEIKLNINNGPIIGLSILTKRIFYLRKTKNNIEIIGLKKPARYR